MGIFDQKNIEVAIMKLPTCITPNRFPKFVDHAFWAYFDFGPYRVYIIRIPAWNFQVEYRKAVWCNRFLRAWRMLIRVNVFPNMFLDEVFLRKFSKIVPSWIACSKIDCCFQSTVILNRKFLSSLRDNSRSMSQNDQQDGTNIRQQTFCSVHLEDPLRTKPGFRIQIPTNRKLQ